MNKPDPRSYARDRHAGQLYGSRPYLAHLDEVAAIVLEHTRDPDIVAAAYLHDVLEDTPTTPGDLAEAGFSTTTINLVAFCTDATGPNRKTRKAATYRRCQAALEDAPQAWAFAATLVKLADRMANVRACQGRRPDLLAMYAKERAGFRAAYSAGDERLQGLWEELEGLLSGA